jgi:hypothetical protein
VLLLLLLLLRGLILLDAYSFLWKKSRLQREKLEMFNKKTKKAARIWYRRIEAAEYIRCITIECLCTMDRFFFFVYPPVPLEIEESDRGKRICWRDSTRWRRISSK